MKIKKDDKVVVISGKEKGKQGKVLRVQPRENRVIIEGVNIVKKTKRPTQKDPQGGFSEKEKAVNASNAMVICPSCGAATRVAYRFSGDGSKVRYCKQCGTDIDKG